MRFGVPTRLGGALLVAAGVLVLPVAIEPETASADSLTFEAVVDPNPALFPPAPNRRTPYLGVDAVIIGSRAPAGWTCTLTSREDGGSEHGGNWVRVSSGGSSAELIDVESRGARRTGSNPIELGGDLSFAVSVGNTDRYDRNVRAGVEPEDLQPEDVLNGLTPDDVMENYVKRGTFSGAVTVTFSCTSPPPPPVAVVLEKLVDGDQPAPPESWTLAVEGTGIAQPGRASGTLTEGAYTLVESGGPPDADQYTTTGWTCTNGSGGSNGTATGTLQIRADDAAAGTQITCTITNTAPSRVEVNLVKAVDGDQPAPPESWTLAVEGTPIQGQGGHSGRLAQGTYTLVESGGPPDADLYRTEGWECSNGSGGPPGSTTGTLEISAADVDAGTPITCRIVNVAPPKVEVILEKIVEGEVQVDPEAWTLAVEGTEISGAGGDAGRLAQGTYTLVETGGPPYADLYRTEGWVCSNGSGGPPGSTTGTLEISAADVDAKTPITCRIVNVAPDPLDVELVKLVGGEDPADPTAWTLAADGTDISGPGGDAGRLGPGTYTLVESGGPPNADLYTTGGWQCSNGSGGSNGTTTGTLEIGAADINAGTPITCTITNTAPEPVDVTLVKVVEGEDPAPPAAWTVAVQGTDISGAGEASGRLGAGTYTLVESGGPPNADLYTTKGWVCSNGSGGPPGSQTGTLEISAADITAGTAITCTIVNPAPLRVDVELVKVVDGQDPAPPTEWNLAVAGTDISGPGGDADRLTQGTYVLIESGGPPDADRYVTNGWECSNGSGGPSGSKIGTLEITGADATAGTAITCTITNVKSPVVDVELVKVVEGGPAEADDWTLAVEGAGISGEGNATGKLAAGAYTLSETPSADIPGGTADYTSDGWSCSNGSGGPGATGTLVIDTTDVAAGTPIVCTATNVHDRLVDVSLVKLVEGGPAEADDWTLAVEGTGISGDGSAAGELAPGTYALTETPSPDDPGETAGYRPEGWSCTNGSGGDPGAVGTLTITDADVDAGTTITCTATNAHDATVEVLLEKLVDGDDPAEPADWTLAVEGTDITGAGVANGPLGEGAYTLIETGGPPDADLYTTGGWTCSNGSGGANLTSTGTLVIDAGDVAARTPITCRITNAVERLDGPMSIRTSPVCVNDAEAWIDYEVSIEDATDLDGLRATIILTTVPDESGDQQTRTLDDMPLSGRFLHPGTDAGTIGDAWRGGGLITVEVAGLAADGVFAHVALGCGPQPTLSVSVNCDPVPFVRYRIDGSSSERFDVTLTDLDGGVVGSFSGLPAQGSVPYPGTQEGPLDWPGWRLDANGSWVRDQSDARLAEGGILTVTSAQVSPVTFPAVPCEPQNPPVSLRLQVDVRGGPAGPSEFVFRAPGNDDPRVPGTYTLVRSGPPDYDLSVACDGLADGADDVTAVTLRPGDQVTCTLLATYQDDEDEQDEDEPDDDVPAEEDDGTEDRDDQDDPDGSRPILTIDKRVVNGLSGTMSGDGFVVEVVGEDPGSDRSDTYEVQMPGPGTYTLDLPGDRPAGYDESLTCDDDPAGPDPATSVTITDTDVTCTFVATYRPQLVLVASVVNDGDGESGPADWMLTADGSGANDVTGSGDEARGRPMADTFELLASGPAGYSTVGWNCTSAGRLSTSDDGRFELTWAGNADVACTVTVDDAGSDAQRPQCVDDGGPVVCVVLSEIARTTECVDAQRYLVYAVNRTSEQQALRISLELPRGLRYENGSVELTVPVFSTTDDVAVDALDVTVLPGAPQRFVARLDVQVIPKDPGKAIALQVTGDLAEPTLRCDP